MSSPSENLPWRPEWSDALSVGIPEIEVKRLMRAIPDDAAVHFAHEETLFKGGHYPQAEQYAKKHARITLALHEIMGSFDHKVEYEWIDAGLKVKQALIGQLLTEDMKYRDYCSKRPGV